MFKSWGWESSSIPAKWSIIKILLKSRREDELFHDFIRKYANEPVKSLNHMEPIPLNFTGITESTWVPVTVCFFLLLKWWLKSTIQKKFLIYFGKSNFNSNSSDCLGFVLIFDRLKNGKSLFISTWWSKNESNC